MITSTLLQYFSENLKIIYFPKTPIIVISFLFIAAASIANRTSFKSIINVNLIILPVVLASMLIIFLSTSKLFVYERLFPILGHGLNATFLSGASNIFAFGGIAILYFIMPFLKNTKQFKKISIIAIVISAVYLFLSVTSLLLVFSYLTNTDETLAIYSLSRSIEFGRFFQRTDALYVFLWIMLVFSYLSIVMALLIYIFKKISNVSDSKMLTHPFSVLLLSLTLIHTNVSITEFMQATVYKYYELILVFFISFVILIAANIKFRKSSKGGMTKL